MSEARIELRMADFYVHMDSMKAKRAMEHVIGEARRRGLTATVGQDQVSREWLIIITGEAKQAEDFALEQGQKYLPVGSE